MDLKKGAADADLAGSLSLSGAGVALCFKVPFRFRQWFKFQALSRNLTMTEFLIKAAEWYSEVEVAAAAQKNPHTDIRK
jgi:hypothetical protein